MFGIGMTELMVLFVVGLVVLGPKRLPALARSLGRTLAEFRHASNDLRRDLMDVTNSIDAKEAVPPDPIDEHARPDPLPDATTDASETSGAAAQARASGSPGPDSKEDPEISGG